MPLVLSDLLVMTSWISALQQTEQPVEAQTDASTSQTMTTKVWLNVLFQLVSNPCTTIGAHKYPSLTSLSLLQKRRCQKLPQSSTQLHHLVKAHLNRNLETSSRQEEQLWRNAQINQVSCPMLKMAAMI